MLSIEELKEQLEQSTVYQALIQSENTVGIFIGGSYVNKLFNSNSDYDVIVLMKELVYIQPDLELGKNRIHLLPCIFDDWYANIFCSTQYTLLTNSHLSKKHFFYISEMYRARIEHLVDIFTHKLKLSYKLKGVSGLLAQWTNIQFTYNPSALILNQKDPTFRKKCRKILLDLLLYFEEDYKTYFDELTNLKNTEVSISKDAYNLYLKFYWKLSDLQYNDLAKEKQSLEQEWEKYIISKY